MGINFGDNFKNIAMQVSSFMRSTGTKTSDADKVSTTHATKVAKADGFVRTEEAENAQQQSDAADANYRAETESACQWASEKELSEAVDEFDNQQVGNGLMILSLLE